MDEGALSPGERRVLALLARGHTAKSIAAETGLSVHAVNERLRDARRKTGAASSRELARLVASQENGDKEIGVPAPAGPGPGGPPPDGAAVARRVRPKELAAMSVIVAGAVAAGWALFAAQSPVADPPSADEAAYAALAKPSDDSAALYDRLRREGRDAAWADRAEPALDGLYAPLPGVGRVRVRCALTLCEVAGTAAPGGEMMAGEALNAEALAAAVRSAGFAGPLASAIGTTTDRPGQFIAYWRRADAAPAAPRVVATRPAAGAAIAPGPFTLRVTFDRPMRPDGWSYVTFDPARFPDCARRPARSSDGRTFALRCRAVAGRSYAVGLNSGPYRGFRGEDGTPAEPYVLEFSAR